ncbi:MAG TPA: hypothetical protein PKD49_06305 [Hyphomicrobium sp.]|nr:hypothetical protein [Hyphomicrobium sp.]
MSTPEPAEFNLWRPWQFAYDECKDRRVRVLKELNQLPIVHELAQDSGFVGRAHAWAWSKQGPTPKGKTPTTWPPEYPSAMVAVGEYYYALTFGYYQHAPDMLEPSPNSFEEAIIKVKALSAANPMLAF